MATQKDYNEEAAIVENSLQHIRQQTIQMRKCLDSKNKLMNALKHASNILSELRTVNLPPKNYYELYIATYDSLEYLGNYLKETQAAHLSNLYELVQYAGNIVPRLYLMITVGTVYMSLPDAPIKEILKDMIEMCRGVQHPIRGLFLRYYLSQRTKNMLLNPSEKSNAALIDCVQFIITNFVEMNKLWVRLQHQGHSKERKKRYQERKELQILVGSNLVRLSQLEQIDKDYYKEKILPAILEQIIQSRDALAQEYLFDVIIQVFPDEFHFYTLQELLDATVQLIPQVSLKKILLTLLDRLTSYVDRESIQANISTLKVTEEVENSQILEKEESSEETDVGKIEGSKVEQQAEVNENSPANSANSKDRLFEIFYNHFTKISQLRPDLTIDELTAIYSGFMQLSLSYYPNNSINVDLILKETLQRFNEAKGTPEFSNGETESNLKKLLLLPLNFNNKLSLNLLLNLENYQLLLAAQPLKISIVIAKDILNTLISNEFKLTSQEEVEKIYDILLFLIKENNMVSTAEELLDDKSGTNETNENLAKLFHLIYNDDVEIHSKLLTIALNYININKKQLIKGSYPTLIFVYFKLARRTYNTLCKLSRKSKKPNTNIQAVESLTKLFELEIKKTLTKITRLIDDLYNQGELETSIKLLIASSELTNYMKNNVFTNDLFIKIFSIYEELVNSKLQYQLIMQLISNLIMFKDNFHSGTESDKENYYSVITKTVIYSARLLKKEDQCRAVFSASHLWFGTDDEENNKKVLECLQKALRIADSCIESNVTVELFIEILNQCVYYYVHGNLISAKYINNLIELIEGNIGSLAPEDQTPVFHLKRTLEYINKQKELDLRFQLIRA